MPNVSINIFNCSSSQPNSFLYSSITSLNLSTLASCLSNSIPSILKGFITSSSSASKPAIVFFVLNINASKSDKPISLNPVCISKALFLISPKSSDIFIRPAIINPPTKNGAKAVTKAGKETVANMPIPETKLGKAIKRGPKTSIKTPTPAPTFTKISTNGLCASAHSLTFLRTSIIFSVISFTAGARASPIVTFRTSNMDFSCFSAKFKVADCFSKASWVSPAESNIKA
ncbi:hypothetical protein ES708_19676 [subsurface metagenome]